MTARHIDVFPISQTFLTMSCAQPFAAFALVRTQRPARACAAVALAAIVTDRRISAPLDPARFPA
ncbi:hypothetical protein [Cupriavidus sp. RAF12]|uniref:hypothetical protein n=1 Tax=Cupriavidus sp. RAF12 TaxID=3233050 RepID=UPI003F90DBAB